MTVPRCELKVQFGGSEDLVVINDPAVIKAIPVLARAMEVYSSTWDEQDSIIEEPVVVPFTRASGALIVAHVLDYEAPTPSESKPEDYPEVNSKTLDELKDLIEASGYMECVAFQNVIGFLIARKLADSSIEEIAGHFGVDYVEGEESMFSAKDGWIQHEPEQ